ncbi:EAL domain-containing protein [Pantoea sp. KPR_PJ]
MGRQLNLRQHYVFLLDPVHAPSGQTIAWELLTRFMPGKAITDDVLTRDEHSLFSCLLATEKWQLFLLQLEQVTQLYKTGFNGIISLNIDSDIINDILKSDAVQQRLNQLPCLRLEISAFFTERYQARDRLQLQNLVAITPALLWLDDFGAGSSTLSMLNSGIFEYVKTDKTFFWKYGEGYAFDSLLSHLNDMSRGVIVQGVDNPQQQDRLMHKPVVGLQGEQWNKHPLTDFARVFRKEVTEKSHKKFNVGSINHTHFL